MRLLGVGIEILPLAAALALVAFDDDSRTLFQMVNTVHLLAALEWTVKHLLNALGNMRQHLFVSELLLAATALKLHIHHLLLDPTVHLLDFPGLVSAIRAAVLLLLPVIYAGLAKGFVALLAVDRVVHEARADAANEIFGAADLLHHLDAFLHVHVLPVFFEELDNLLLLLVDLIFDRLGFVDLLFFLKLHGLFDIDLLLLK